MEDRHLELLTEFFHRVTFGMERKKYKDFDLGVGVFVLLYIGKFKECTMKDIINELNISASTATRRVDKLVKFGLVERYMKENDRRSISVKLTNEGTEVYNEINKRRYNRFETIKNNFDEEELAIFFKIIEYFINQPHSESLGID